MLATGYVRTTLRTPILVAVAFCVAPVLARADQTVNVGPSLSFSPKTVTVAPGEIVTWTWLGSPHSSTSDATSGPEVWDSGLLSTGATFSHTFSTPGSYPYHCVIHGAVGGIGMSGTVIVAAATPTPSPTPPIATPTPTATPASGAPAPIPDVGIGGKVVLAVALAGIAILILILSRPR